MVDEVHNKTSIFLNPTAMAIVIATVVCVASVAVRANRSQVRVDSNRDLVTYTPKVSNEGGYQSSDTCISCHPSQHQSWHDSYHRKMTQVATRETVYGDFDNVELDYFGKKFLLTTDGDEFWVTQGENHRRVVQTTGSHHYQVYWMASEDGLLVGFPLVFLIDEQRWVPRNDVFMVPPELANQPEKKNTWNFQCIKCHSTHGQPKLDPVEKQANTTVGELGIGCESCHGPGREHVEHYSNPVNRYRQHLSGTDDTKIINPVNCSKEIGSQICGQCHAITRFNDRGRWFREGFVYRPGEDLNLFRKTVKPGVYPDSPPEYFKKFFWSDGMIRISGREYNGLIDSPCYKQGEMTCLSCHSMHDSDPVDQIAPEMTGNQACLQCHSDMADSVEQHTHHAADSQGSLCYNCHMPHTTSGLVKALRSHQVSSPSVAATMETGRPHACNLCHLDKTLEWTSDLTSEWYGETKPLLMSDDQRTVSAAVLDLLSGDASQRALAAWHMGWQPALEASGDDWQAPLLAQSLTDPYPVVRSIAGRSLKKLSGFEDVEYDYIAPEDERTRSSVDVTATWEARETPSTKAARSEILQDERGDLMEVKMNDLILHRDNSPVYLHE